MGTRVAPVPPGTGGAPCLLENPVLIPPFKHAGEMGKEADGIPLPLRCATSKPHAPRRDAVIPAAGDVPMYRVTVRATAGWACWRAATVTQHSFAPLFLMAPLSTSAPPPPPGIRGSRVRVRSSLKRMCTA